MNCLFDYCDYYFTEATTIFKGNTWMAEDSNWKQDQLCTNVEVSSEQGILVDMSKVEL